VGAGRSGGPATGRQLHRSHYGQPGAAGRTGAAGGADGAGEGGITMLRTNLSTRPFYNERGIHTGLGVAAMVVAALTIFNLAQIVMLTSRQSDLNGRAAAA